MHAFGALISRKPLYHLMTHDETADHFHGDTVTVNEEIHVVKKNVILSKMMWRFTFVTVTFTVILECTLIFTLSR